tara:strand:+ start:188 stop:349 length:162 start_codon:yes stop_codon:yes gene_type:complete
MPVQIPVVVVDLARVHVIVMKMSVAPTMIPVPIQSETMVALSVMIAPIFYSHD